MTQEFQQRRNAALLGLEPIDAEAMRFVTSWHRHPSIHDALWYRGINIGEPGEYLLFQDSVTILVEREQGHGT